MKCRHCSADTKLSFLDLGFAPPSNSYLTAEDLTRPEKYFPLRVKVCNKCWLVQTEDYALADELFNSEYAYFSSTSLGWLAHAFKYTEAISSRLQLNKDSLVIEVASNDGYLLKNFVSKGIPCLGIEPTASTATVAEKLGIPILRQFFGEQIGLQLAAEGKRADLIIGNNVYAHVPDVNDFTKGLKAALKLDGTITLEFPHLMRLLEHIQFDTVYHEHFSYFSLYTVKIIFEAVGLRIWDVEELPTHGGSLRIYGCHLDDVRDSTFAVAKILKEEAQQGLQSVGTYVHFQHKVNCIKNEFLAFLIEQKRLRKTVAAYGAAAKGSTFLNFAGVKPDLLPFVCDASVSKQGKFMPGSHIPILQPGVLLERRPDYLIILPWNIATEVRLQNVELKSLGTKFVTAIPNIEFS